MDSIADPTKGTSRRDNPAYGQNILSRKQFRPDIEGLRAVAVLAVVLFHAGLPGFTGGFIGVDVFFVVSGFLITGLLWREVSDSGSIRIARFYGARARRLLPAAGTVLIATTAAAAALLPPLQARSVIGDAIASALYVGNYRFAVEGTDYLNSDAPPSPFQHYWSLGVEEQFYLLWPALILGSMWLAAWYARRRGIEMSRTRLPVTIALAVVCVASLVASFAMTENWPSWAFFSLPTRAWELAVGGLVALTVTAWRQLPSLSASVAGWGGLALILVMCTQIGQSTPYPGTTAVLPVLGTALVIGAGCATPNSGVARVLSIPQMRGLGRLSYSWYLWHWPVLLLAPPLFKDTLGLPARLALALISLGLAVLTLHLIENPVRYAPSLKESARSSLTVGASVTAVAVTAAVLVLTVRPVPVGHGVAAPPVAPPSAMAASHPVPPLSPLEQIKAAVSASAGPQPVPSNLTPPLSSIDKPEVFVNGCVLSWHDVEQPQCVSGDAGSTGHVALVGDSHAAMWQPAFEQIGSQRHWKISTMSKVTCPPLELPISSPYLGRQFGECVQWRQNVMKRLAQERPQLVVLDMSRRYGADFGFVSYDQTWLTSLTKFVQQMRANGSRVLVLGPAPDPGSTVPTCLSAHMDNADACSPARMTALNTLGMNLEMRATEAAGGRYANLDQVFCTAQRCPAIVGNTLVYRDDNHITREYAQELAPVMAGLADQTLV